MSPYALKRCVIPGLPERRIVRGLVSDVCPGRGPLTPARGWLLTYPPSAWSWSRRWEGAAAKSQAGRCQRTGTSLEALSGALTAQGSLPITRIPYPGPVGFALWERSASLRGHACFLLGLWPLLSASRWNFLWTLLYLNSPMNSERIAGRLLCNSVTKYSGIESWFSQAIPEVFIWRGWEWH